MLTTNYTNMKYSDKLRELNPYPVEAFTEPKEGEVKKATQLMIDNGISPERVYADLGRDVWNNVCDLLSEFEKDS